MRQHHWQQLRPNEAEMRQHHWQQLRPNEAEMRQQTIWGDKCQHFPVSVDLSVCGQSDDCSLCLLTCHCVDRVMIVCLVCGQNYDCLLFPMSVDLLQHAQNGYHQLFPVSIDLLTANVQNDDHQLFPMSADLLTAYMYRMITISSFLCLFACCSMYWMTTAHQIVCT